LTGDKLFSTFLINSCWLAQVLEQSKIKHTPKALL